MTGKQDNKIQKKIVSILTKSEKPIPFRALKQMMSISGKNLQHFEMALAGLTASGEIKKENGKYQISVYRGAQIVQGELRMTRSGFGFVREVETATDIYISRDHLNTAFDRDTVEVKLYAKRRGKSMEGFVTKIISRKRKKFVGTYHKTKFYGFVVPDDQRIYRDFFIPSEMENKAKEGQKVLVELIKWETDHLNPEGKISEIIGYPGEPGVDVASVAHSFEIPIRFPEIVEKESSQIPEMIDPEEIKKRTDLRKLTVFTIDPVDAKDFDDAVSLEKLPNGNYSLGVHIADVSYYVVEKSKIDDEAFNRGTSVYMVDRVIPMLPEYLSNGLCSLKEKEEKLTYTCQMEVTPVGDVVKYKIMPTVICSTKRFTYEEVQVIVNGEMESPLSNTLQEMMALSKLLTKKRFAEGGVDFETPEISFRLDEQGFPAEIHRKERLDSHRLVEEFMLLANKTVAKHIHGSVDAAVKKPFIYRVHEKPDQEKMKKFFDFLHALKIEFKPVKRVNSQYFHKLLKGIKGTKEELVIEEVALRSMMKAVYATKNIGHFGLGFDDYTHFTSPIRRYPDLIVHRLLKEYDQDSRPANIKEKLSYLSQVCEQSNATERTAMEAERESIRQKQVEYISQHIGEEFIGFISGVLAFGIFVELEDTLVEGLVHIRDLADDYYIYDEKTYTLIGRDTDRILRLGDEVKIRVVKASLEAGKVDFALLPSLLKK